MCRDTEPALGRGQGANTKSSQLVFWSLAQRLLEVLALWAQTCMLGPALSWLVEAMGKNWFCHSLGFSGAGCQLSLRKLLQDSQFYLLDQNLTALLSCCDWF